VFVHKQVLFHQVLLFRLAGYKKEVAGKKQRGEMKSDEGKRPIPFPLLIQIANWMIESIATTDARLIAFAHAFMTLSWCISCRSNSTADIHLSSVSWSGDALTVTLEKSKGDVSLFELSETCVFLFILR